MIEADVEDTVVYYAERTGWLARKMKYARRPDCRDHDFYGFGYTVHVEFKRPGGDLRLSQIKERDRLARKGVTIHTVDTIAQGTALLDRYRRHARKSDLPWA